MTKSNFFFGYTDTEEKYTEKHLIRVTSEVIGNKSLRKEEIFEEVVNRYDGMKINYSAFKSMLEENFQCDGKLYYQSTAAYINSTIKPVVKGADYHFKKSKYVLALNNYASNSIDELNHRFYQIINNPFWGVMDAITLAMAINTKQGISISDCADKCIDIETNLDGYIERISKALGNIVEENLNLLCSYIIPNGQVLQMLGAENIYAVKDLSTKDPKLILVLCSIDIGCVLLGIESLSTSYKSKLDNTINNTVASSLKERYYEMILRRNGYFTEKPVALEIIGEDYGVTRERIRQIIAKASKNLASASARIKDTLNNYFSLLLESEEQPYIRIIDILSSAENRDTVFNACLLLISTDIKYKYDEKYHIIFDSDLTSTNIIEENIIIRLGKLVATSRYESSSDFEKEVIDNNYALSGRQHNLYHLKNYNQTDFLIDLITELFPNGYVIYSESDYDIFAKEYSNRLGDDVEVPSSTAVRGIVGRDGGVFCQIDRGTYKLRTECATIPIELFDRIYDFIVANLPMVDYATIYKNFERELLKYGIDNYFYMKGIIDYSLPDDLTTKRNYITTTESQITAVEARINYMRSFSNAFTLDDLIEKFPGVKPYVFQFLCYDEEKNGLLHIGIRKYIYANKLNINTNQIEQIKNIVEETFGSANSDILSSRKIYARIKLLYPELLEELPIIADQHAAFSIIKYLFPDEYYYDRPYISKEKPDEEGITTSGLIISYLEKQHIIDYEKYKNYCFKMNIPMIYSYMQLVDVFSDNYVQINDRQLILKEDFNISENQLKEIENVLDLILGRAGKLSTSRFNGYMMFPTIKYKWNKHVLAGIVRSYFSDKYEIKNITNASVSEAVDYEIERYTV